MRKLLASWFLTLLQLYVIGQIKSPYDFLPTNYGQQFTPHHELVNYVNHIAQNSDRVQLVRYGTTNEDRPLYLCYISTPNNLANLNSIREKQLASIDMAEGNTEAPRHAIIWMSFGVHGNEAGGPESGMNILYQLADPSNKTTEKYLENTIVILDPSVNPDGYSRYTHWVRSISSKKTHPGLTDREHMEPWPGGRVNHYLFDLNRDWAWQTQVESQQRIKMYNQWMPHVHVDFHEMGYNDHYYFAPAAEPYHPFISNFQRNFQIEIGKNNAKYFDQEGWLYFTREIFDLYYPSYGDTYPTFNGAVGMTYEKAGHGMAGRAIQMDNGDTLTLQDRIDHHTTTGLATVEIASQNYLELIQQFTNYFANGRQKPLGKYRTYILKNNPKLSRLVELLDKNGINYGYAVDSKSSRGFNYQSMTDQSFSIEAGDLIIQQDQPKAILTQVLFEPEASLSDSLTYDITAWALPYAYGIESYATTTAVKVETTKKKMAKSSYIEEAYAYYLPWQSIESAKLVAKLHALGVQMRCAKKEVIFDESVIPRGSIIITKGDNKNIDLAHVLNQELEGHDLYSLSTGFSSKGGDLGGSTFTLLKKPNTLLLSGKNTSNNEVGQVWHFFDEVIGYELSIVDIDNFGWINLAEFNTLILPDGWYRLEEDQLKSIEEWVGNGGKLIAIDGALHNMANKEGWALSKYATEDEKSAAEKDSEAKELAARLHSYEDAERRNISGSIPGAIFENKMDLSHPLTFGLGDTYFSLKTGTKHFSLLKNAWNPIYLDEDFKSIGFVGAEVKNLMKQTTTYAVEEKGSGTVIYMVDNPLYRGFWENGLLLFSNAIFLVP